MNNEKMKKIIKKIKKLEYEIDMSIHYQTIYLICEFFKGSKSMAISNILFTNLCNGTKSARGLSAKFSCEAGPIY